VTADAEAPKKSLTVPPESQGERLDVFVGKALGLGRARVKELFEADAVRVEGRRAKKGDAVQAGARVSVELPAEAPALSADESFTLPVLYEDSWLIAVDKPAGRPSHPLEAGELGTVANALVARYPECATASIEPREGGLCHRLDIETSGVLLAARDRQTWEAVRDAFSRRAVDKYYWGLVTGPLADEGEIDLPLRHHPRRADRVVPANVGAREDEDALGEAREALSRFRVLARSGEYSLVEVQILTGVLHQVRAHLSAVGAPLVGDALYGGRPDALLSRFFLHARRLGLTHPKTGKKLVVESPLPPELGAVLAAHGLVP
jgi:23S rRNA pseudouridine1911/1915/1917 synthase